MGNCWRRGCSVSLPLPRSWTRGRGRFLRAPVSDALHARQVLADRGADVKPCGVPAALNAHDDFADLRHDYGQSLLRLGREDEALGEMERAVALAPDCAFCRKNLGQLYRRKGERRARAGRQCRTTGERGGMADVRESWRLLRRAVEEYRTAEALDPFDLTIVHDLAFLHAEGGNEAAFRQKLEEFIKRARNEPELAELVQPRNRFSVRSVAHLRAQTIAMNSSAGDTLLTGRASLNCRMSLPGFSDLAKARLRVADRIRRRYGNGNPSCRVFEEQQSDRRSRAVRSGRVLLCISAMALGLAIWIESTGGIRRDFSLMRLSVRGSFRPFLVSAVCGLVGLATLVRRFQGH